MFEVRAVLTTELLALSAAMGARSPLGWHHPLQHEGMGLIHPVVVAARENLHAGIKVSGGPVDWVTVQEPDCSVHSDVSWSAKSARLILHTLDSPHGAPGST